MERYENVIVIALLTASNVLKICSVVALCYTHSYVNRDHHPRRPKVVKNMKRLKQSKNQKLRYTTRI